MEHLFNKFEEHLIALVVMLHDVLPKNILDDVEFFIMEPWMDPSCKTNVTVCFQLGQWSAKTTGRNAPLLRALYILVTARDGILKGYPEAEIKSLLHQTGLLIQAAKTWDISELNYG